MYNNESETEHKPLEVPDCAAEFTAALEAAHGQPQPTYFTDPMAADKLLEGCNRILMAPHPDRGLEILARTGVLNKIMPEVNALVGFGDGEKHKDVWRHTLQVVCQTPPRLLCRWGGLLHDIGKVPTRRFGPSGEVTFIGHPEIGARMFERMAERIPFPSHARDGIRFLIAAHLRGSAYQEDWTDSAVRRFIRDGGPVLHDLLDLARADITSKYEEKVKRGLRQINSLAIRIEAIQEIDAKPPPLPKGLGAHLMREFRITPGPGLGRLMDALADLVDNGALPAGDTFQVYIDFLHGNEDMLRGALADEHR